MIARGNSLPKMCLAMLIASLPSSAGIMYMSDGDGLRIVSVDLTAGTFSTDPAFVSQRAFPIAVAGTIRTTGYADGETGAEYELDGTPTGTTYPLASSSFALADGTTDGQTYNYAQNFFGGVYRFDRNWANPVLLFNVPSFAGITYDLTDNTLWLSADRAAGISHYDLSGNLLGSFSTVGGLDWNLALDHTTGSLWVSQFDGNTFYEYSKAGALLSTVTVPGLSASSFFSGEFNANDYSGVPEPATGALAALGFAGFVAARRLRRRAR